VIANDRQNSERCAYSDLAVTKSGTILCFYGRSEKSNFAGDRLTLARFNLEWLTDGAGLVAPWHSEGGPLCPSGQYYFFR
jgi:hypothetical protein